MREILTDENMDDDLKSKSYIQSLTRFINTKTSIPQEKAQEPIEKQPVEKQPVARATKKTNKKPKKKLTVRHSPIRLRPKTKKRKFDETIWSEY